MSKEEPFTNREIKGFFDNIKELLVGHATVHSEILSQVKLTNGKVILNTAYRNYLTGAVGVILVILVPVLFWAVSTIVEVQANTANLDILVSQAVQDALTVYETP